MSLIQTAQQSIDQSRLVVEHLSQLEVLPENVTHILANIASAANAGSSLKIMHINSIASFMAGVEVIATNLPASQDEAKKQSTIRALSAAGIGSDGLVNGSVAPIAQLGARNREQHAKYSALVVDYMKSVDSGKPAGRQLSQAARLLQQSIDQAMRVSTKQPQRSTAKGVSNVS